MTTYYDSQIARLGEAETYVLKLHSEHGETNWVNITQPQLAEVKRILNQAQVQSTMDHLNGLPLTDALWWFIENVNEDDPHHSEVFFYLRERYRAPDPKPRTEP